MHPRIMVVLVSGHPRSSKSFMCGSNHTQILQPRIRFVANGLARDQ